MKASSRLDPATEGLLERAVDRLLQGRTAIIIAHRLATVERADEIVLLEAGQIVEQGARIALARDPTSRFSQLRRIGTSGGVGMTRQVYTTPAPSDRADRMNVWRAVWRLVRFAPWLFVANALIWIVEDFFYLARGLVLRQIFDTLTDHAQLDRRLLGAPGPPPGPFRNPNLARGRRHCDRGDVPRHRGRLATEEPLRADPTTSGGTGTPWVSRRGRQPLWW